MDRRMHCIIPNESYNINHNITILEPEILGNHNINIGTTLLLKTIVN